MTFDELPELLSVRQAATYLGWSWSRVRRAIDNGRLKANGGKGSWMTIPKADFKRFCNGEEGEPAPEPKRRVRQF